MENCHFERSEAKREISIGKLRCLCRKISLQVGCLPAGRRVEMTILLNTPH